MSNASNFFPIDLNNPEHNSEPARYILKNVDHIITWPIVAPAPKKRSIRKNLEALFNSQLKPSLNEPKEFDSLILFNNGITSWFQIIKKLRHTMQWRKLK